jgi:hypothetical protein
MINGNIHYKWSFSIAMLNYQRVSILCPHLVLTREEGISGIEPENPGTIGTIQLPSVNLR